MLRFYVLIWIGVVTVFLCSCGSNFTPEIKEVTLHAETQLVKSQDTLTINYSVEQDDHIPPDELYWQTDHGQISIIDDQVIFVAPSYSCTARISVALNEFQPEAIQDTLQLIVFHQIIILKADDIIYQAKYGISPKWQRYLDYIRKRDLKSALGLVCISLMQGNQVYIDWLQSIAADPHFELFNHGYTHEMKNGNKAKPGYWEFQNSSYSFQKEHLLKAQAGAKYMLGITLHTFGAPGNAIDSTTTMVMQEVPDLKVWFYGDKQSEKLVLPRISIIEDPVFEPNFTSFLKYYQPQYKYLVLQVHPNVWDEKDFAEFDKVIDYLMVRECTFMNPYEYYLLLNGME